MFTRLPQSTSVLVVLKAFLKSDHVSAATGKTIAIKISKNGGAFGDPNAGATNATEIANGWYKVTMDSTDTGTAGPLIVRGTETNTDDTEVSFLIGDGLAHLDADVSSRMATYTQPTGFLAATFPSGTIANTTNITAGTITTTTNLTTNNDKTGYSLSQAFPSNFSSLAITAGGATTVGTNSDKTGYSLAADQAVNVTKINGSAVVGTGTGADLWRHTP